MSHGKPITPRDTRGLPRVVIEKSASSKSSAYTHDWTDKTTWYQEAIRIVDETVNPLTPGVYTTYTLAHTFVIDTYHGKITQEDYLVDTNGNSYRVSVKVNGVSKVEVDPHTGVGDFTVDYAAGRITFSPALIDTDIVTVTYHYATSSKFTIKPQENMRLTLEFVEVQFSDDVVITDTVKFQAYGYVIAFAPQLAVSNGGPLPDLTKIPLGNPVTYKGFRDFYNDAVKSYVAYPALGGSGWRGMSRPIYVFDWDYVRATELNAAAGMELVTFLEHDVPFTGTYATVTFYCAEEPL